MADRFPLIVNESSRKIEEIVSGDNLDLTGNGIIIGGNPGVSGQYLKSLGSGGMVWDSPGNVYLTQTQTLSNKTLLTSTISGSVNTLTNIPNSALVNPSITVNSTVVALGGSVSTPDSNTTYKIDALDGTTAAQKIIRLESTGTNAGITDDIVLAVGAPSSIPIGSKALSLALDLSSEVITLSGTVADSDTVTTLVASGGSAQSGNITIVGNGCDITMNDSTKTITVTVQDDDTITTFRAGTGQTAQSGDFTLLAGNFITLQQGVDSGNPNDNQITISSVDTVTRVKGGASGTLVTGDITIAGGTHLGGNTTVQQSGNTIQIDSANDNTITGIAVNNAVPAAGNYRFKQAGATTITNEGIDPDGYTVIQITSENSDTGASLGAGTGITLSGSNFSIKNNANLTDNRVTKWDQSNGQFINSIIDDNGSTVTINGDLTVTGTNTILETSTLVVEDNMIELRKGNNLLSTNLQSGVQINRTTNSLGEVTDFVQLQWFESGGYWRSFTKSGTARRFVTETETQTLTNKTLDSPTLNTPNLGQATASSINGLAITSNTGAALSIGVQKTLSVNNTLTFTGTDGAIVNFGNGTSGQARTAFTSDTLAVFASTTSIQLLGIVTDSTGTGYNVFSSDPTFTVGVKTTSTSFSVFNTTATTVNAFGAATTLNIGKSGGNTTVAGNLIVNEDLTIGSIPGDVFLVNSTANFEATDIIIRGTSLAPMKIGRGGGALSSNTRIGFDALESNQNGINCTAVGYEALRNNDSGYDNIAVGKETLRQELHAIQNVVVGNKAGRSLNPALSDQLADARGNTIVGHEGLYSSTTGSFNTIIGYKAGWAALGDGNVIIGAASNGNAADAVYQPESASGNNQLIIASGSQAWIRGDSNFNVKIPKDLSVFGALLVDGDLVVNGTTTTINARELSVDDKNIVLGDVDVVTFDCTVDGTAVLSGVTSTAGLIVGMEVESTSTAVIPLGTYITDITSNTITLSQVVTGQSGSASFKASGPTDLGANGGGIILKAGTPSSPTNKTILYDHTRTDKYWVMSENLELASGKKFVIGNQLMLNSTTLGPTIVNSSLTSVGTLTSLTTSGNFVSGGRIIEKTLNNFGTALTPNAGVATISVATSNTILYTPAASPINTWNFSNVNLSDNQSITITLILDANTAATYGDACDVDGVSITTGVQWSGGSPPVPTANTDILTFIIVRDSNGTTKVFGQGNTDFS